MTYAISISSLENRRSSWEVRSGRGIDRAEGSRAVIRPITAARLSMEGSGVQDFLSRFLLSVGSMTQELRCVVKTLHSKASKPRWSVLSFGCEAKRFPHTLPGSLLAVSSQ